MPFPIVSTDQIRMTDQTPFPNRPEGDGTADRFPVGLILILLAWLGLAVPLFLRMPLTNDAELFDLHARMLASGKTLYQDILEPNLPGVIWIHSIVRTVAGQSSEAMRCFDLLVFGGLMTLSYRWLRQSGISRVGGTATVLSASVFYLSGSEWIHCQRDTWMLAVTLLAATLRCRSLSNRDTQSPLQAGLLSAAEGLIWGVGIWLKPYVVLVAIAVWLVTVRHNSTLRLATFDSLGLFIGGLLAGLAGLGWMAGTGCLTAFLEQSREWNPHYFTARSAQWTLDRFVPMTIRFLPWMLLHPLAALVSLDRIRQTVANSSSGKTDSNASLRSTVLSAIYLAWCVHMFLLQHLFDYVHAPGVLLAILVTADWLSRWSRRGAVQLCGYAFAVLAVFLCPYLDTARISNWPLAFGGQLSEETRDQLACFENPNRVDMERVTSYLKSREARDGDVLCFNSDIVSLYRRLGFMPPTKFIYVDQNAAYVPSASDTILQTLMQSGHKYVVTDMLTSGVVAGFRDEVRDGEQSSPVHLPGTNGVYPWNQPVVLRAGTYLVHEITEDSQKLYIPGKPLEPITKSGNSVSTD